MKSSLAIGLALLAAILSSISPGTAIAAPEEVESVWYNCRTREVFTPEKQEWCRRWQVVQNASYIVPMSLDSNPTYTTVAFSNSRYQPSDEFIVELVNERGWQSFGDINGDDKTDAAVIFGVALDPNGRQLATYLTAVLDVDGTAQALRPIRLGGRILLNAPIHIADQQITIPFLTVTEAFDRHYGVVDAELCELDRHQQEPRCYDRQQ